MESLKNNILIVNDNIYYLEIKNNNLIAGFATNCGIIPQYQIAIDPDSSLDINIMNLYEIILHAEE